VSPKNVYSKFDGSRVPSSSTSVVIVTPRVLDLEVHEVMEDSRKSLVSGS
jgi:hypothetical protein